MKKSTRYYDIYDVSIFDLLKSDKFSSGKEINEDLLAEQYERGYLDGEEQIRNNYRKDLDELIDKAKLTGELLDKNTVKKFGEYVGERAYAQASDEYDKKINEAVNDFDETLVTAYDENIINKGLDMEINIDELKEFNKYELDINKRLSELTGYTKAIIPSIKLPDKGTKQLIHSTMDEEIDELIENEDLTDKDYDYPEKTKQLRNRIKQLKDDISKIPGNLKKEYNDLKDKLNTQQKKTTRKSDIQVNMANKKLKEFITKNNQFNLYNELKDNEMKLNEYRKSVKDRIDTQLKKSILPTEMLYEGVPLGKGRYHASYQYARTINPTVYNPENLYKRAVEMEKDLFNEYNQLKQNYLIE